jgi:hypothetical protein
MGGLGLVACGWLVYVEKVCESPRQQRSCSQTQKHAHSQQNRAGNPRNNLRRNGTFLLVQRLDRASNAWVDVFTDDDWSTKFLWERHWQLRTHSFATIK